MRYNRKLLLSSLIAVGLIGFGVLANWYLVYVSAAQPLAINQAPNPYQELYDELLRPSVMVIASSGIGSGVVITSTDKTTYILTAAHVVGDEASVKVTFFYPNNNSTAITGSVVATDTIKDLALIRTYTYKPYPYVAKLAPKDYVPYIFTPVWVVGCSLGLPPRPTEGTITTLSDLSVSAVEYWGINAPIWPGNSGGGVFLKETNELIGIVIWMRVYRWQLATTIGGVVPLQDIYEFLKECPDTACRDLTRCNDQRSNSE